MRGVSLAIVGADHPNKRGPSRRFGIALCRPGDAIELRREPRNQFDEFAIGVWGKDVQLGYVRSERAAWLAPMLDRGRTVTAIFQEATDYGCAIRIAFDGERPALPPPTDRPDVDPDFAADDDPGFWPDEAPDE